MTHLQAISSSEADSGVAPAATRGAVTFFVMVFASTWFLQLPYILAKRGLLESPAERFFPLVVLGFFAPALLAVLLACFERGGLRALFRPLGVWRVGAGWYVVALGLSAAILVAGMAVHSLFASGDAGPWFYPPANAQTRAALLVIPFAEQIAWRGFAFPRLERRYGSLTASLIVGVLWALFHIQKHTFLDDAHPPNLIPIMILWMTAGTVVFTWIYNRTGGSLLLVVVAHMGVYLNNSYAALPTNATPLIVHAVGYCVVAVALVLVDRNAWRQRKTSAAMRGCSR